jgi:hypothetical protein
VVLLPDAEAEVWCNGQLVQAPGTRRAFRTPHLEATGVIDFTRPDDTRRMPPASPE